MKALLDEAMSLLAGKLAWTPTAAGRAELSVGTASALVTLTTISAREAHTTLAKADRAPGGWYCALGFGITLLPLRDLLLGSDAQARLDLFAGHVSIKAGRVLVIPSTDLSASDVCALLEEPARRLPDLLNLACTPEQLSTSCRNYLVRDPRFRVSYGTANDRAEQARAALIDSILPPATTPEEVPSVGSCWRAYDPTWGMQGAFHRKRCMIAHALYALCAALHCQGKTDAARAILAQRTIFPLAQDHAPTLEHLERALASA